MGRGSGTCGGCGADVDHEDHCCATCADEHDEAVKSLERTECAALVESLAETIGPQLAGWIATRIRKGK